MHNNVIIGLSVLAAFTLSIMLALYGLRFVDRDRQWRPRRYGVSAREVSCSFCGKLVRSEAIMCRHCHHRLDEVVPVAGTDEVPDGGEPGPVGVLQPSDRRLAPAAAVSYETADADPTQNQSFAWLDSAFAQLTVKAAPATWGPTVAEREIVQDASLLMPKAVDAVPQQDDSTGKNEVAVRTIGPLSRQPGVDTQKADGWFHAWVPKKEWAAVAAGIATLAVIVGGSTVLVGPTKSKIEAAADEYVTFDVSERAPLYTGPNTTEQTKAEPPAVQPVPEPAKPTAAPPPEPVAVKPAALVAPMEPVSVAKPEAIVAAKSEPVIETPKPAVPDTALPVLPPMPAEDKAAAAMAAITPSQSGAKSEPVVAPRREEDWASTVARAIKPAPNRDLIVAVQRLIRAEGYDPGTIDGNVGPRTRQAIRQYQRNGGLPQTGEIDRDLLKKLNLADRTVRVLGPLGGVASAAPVRSTAKPPTEWTK